MAVVDSTAIGGLASLHHTSQLPRATSSNLSFKMSRFATLDSLRKKDGEEGKQSFYAGGAGANGGR